MGIKKENLGYDNFFEQARLELGLENFPVARVISQQRDNYKVINQDGELFAKITGKQMFLASFKEDYPAVGDWVVIEKIDNNHALINAVLKRKTIIKRKFGDKNKIGRKDEVQIIAANVYVAFVVESVDRDYNLNRLERYLAITKSGGVKPAIILNKIDLISSEDYQDKLNELNRRFVGVDVIVTSAIEDSGFDQLVKYIKSGLTYCFLGSSGVGKSSLINKLLGKEVAKTGAISMHSERGKHITTNRQMYFLEGGGILIDNPGMREVGLTDAGCGVDAAFDQIALLARSCRFPNCSHVQEPGCEVIKAVKLGELDSEKYSNYLELKKENDYYEMNNYEKRESDKKFGKFMKKAKEDLKKYNSKY
ncbi:MAG: putative ribosome biogenesis GTPase RsgA [bacterium ADurb.Bin212]|nr:MAG: putative ribosome biogenesis GTPase RsgA [bacterium ADurb.Bin212]